MPKTLEGRLQDEFTSIGNLKSEMLATAYSMFGPGFVWLVRTAPNSDVRKSGRQFKLLTTYLAGSPLPGAHHRRQPADMNTQNAQNAEAAGSLRGLSEQEFRRQTEVQNTPGIYGKTRMADSKVAFGGVGLTPVLCVSTWEHAWLFDFTVDGKMEYLQRWWDLVNWDKVEADCAFQQDQSYQAGGQAFAHGSSRSGTERNALF